MTKATKAPKTIRVPVTDINQLSFTTTDKTGAIATFRAGEIGLVLSQLEGCKIFLRGSNIHVDSKDSADAVNGAIAHCYQTAQQGYYEVQAVTEAAPANTNRSARRAAAAKKGK